ncbi:MAG: choice-of-anchor tandem repeat GloVer-containing protein [Thermoguttaceae bacterium]
MKTLFVNLAGARSLGTQSVPDNIASFARAGVFILLWSARLLRVTGFPLSVLLWMSVAEAQTYTTLHSFAAGFGAGSSGSEPSTGLALVGSTLYGTTSEGGANNGGTIFSLGTNGSNFTVLHNFNSGSSDGVWGSSTLTVVNSTLFGTTFYGGGSDGGTIFSINANGTGYTIMHSFGAGSDGWDSSSDLTLIGSALYGTCQRGGSNASGTVFKINTDGSGYSTVFSFPSAPGPDPGPSGGLTVVGSTLYGTTFHGGEYSDGSIFSIDSNGSGYKDLYDFTGGTDGQQPFGSLVTDGSFLYGVDDFGGAHSAGVLYRIALNGAGFTVLHDTYGGSFFGQPPTLNGSTLYCPGGGIANDGEDIFEMKTNGTDYTELYTSGGAEGDLLLTGSTIYGCGGTGEANDMGSVFALNLNPAPEPSTLALLAAGAMGLIGCGWRRKVLARSGMPTAFD